MNDNEKTKKGLWEWITMLLNITNLILIVFILYKMPKNAKSDGITAKKQNFNTSYTSSNRGIAAKNNTYYQISPRNMQISSDSDDE